MIVIKQELKLNLRSRRGENLLAKEFYVILSSMEYGSGFHFSGIRGALIDISIWGFDQQQQGVWDCLGDDDVKFQV